MRLSGLRLVQLMVFLDCFLTEMSFVVVRRLDWVGWVVGSVAVRCSECLWIGGLGRRLAVVVNGPGC